VGQRDDQGRADDHHGADRDRLGEHGPAAVVVGLPRHRHRGCRHDADATPWHGALPELLFPADHSWLVSTLWDDDWRCVGGSAALVHALLEHPDLGTRAVTVGEDATPPGHAAL
jgi:hypothetical protein